MIAFLCNHCKQPIDLSNEWCAHMEIKWGKDAIETSGKYGSGYSADLCADCYQKLGSLIDDYYYGGNKYLKSNGQK